MRCFPRRQVRLKLSNVDATTHLTPISCKFTGNRTQALARLARLLRSRNSRSTGGTNKPGWLALSVHFLRSIVETRRLDYSL